MEPIEKMFNNLPEYLQKKVIGYINLLQIQTKPKRNKQLKLDWLGGLKELKDKYTSVELQHKISDWRAG